MDRIRADLDRRLTAAQVVARLTPRQGLKLAEDIARLSFRRALQEEAERSVSSAASRRHKAAA